MISKFNNRLFISGIVLFVFIFCLQGCGGAALKPWHTEKLDEEFTQQKAEEVRSFSDYLELEDRLFKQLDDRIYSESESGTAFLLDRYSPGSAADPHTIQPNWNRSFELKAKNPRGGILLLHGMSDSPYSLRALGQALNQKGYWVIGLRLPGHGTVPSELRFLDLGDMTAAVRLGMSHLITKVKDKPVHMVGYSTGAPLAMEFTLDAIETDNSPVPSSLVLISPAIAVHPSAGLASFKNALSALPGLDGMAYLSLDPEFDPYKYNSFATNAGDIVHRITRSVSGRIQDNARNKSHPGMPPILVFKSTVDATVTTQAVVDSLLIRLKPERHELVLFDINRHAAVESRLLISDPAPLTNRVMQDGKLPFAVTLVTNKNNETTEIVSRYKPAYSDEVIRTRDMNTSWPDGVISLSHVALPFPPDDPVYGQNPPENQKLIFLGQIALQGERGLLTISPNWMIRLRYNPFYDYLEQRTLDWINHSNETAIKQRIK
jgi:alpha-beta hydrolase superfamily lysophospholipase